MHSIVFVPLAGSSRSSVHASSDNNQSQHNRQRRSVRARVQRQRAWFATCVIALISCVTMALTGCGSVMTGPSSQLAGPGSLVASANSLAFGSVTVGQKATATVTLQNSSTDAVQISAI